MYIPKHFDEPRTDVLHDLMRERSLATMITMGSTGLSANHIPLFLDATKTPLGTLRGHVSRSNPVWKTFDPAVEALAVLSGPDAYVTPSWYATKKETGAVVPTWNYVVAHAYGTLRVIDDPSWVRANVEELTRHKESARAEPWAVGDAPAEYVERLLKGIVGIEIVVRKLEGKWKVSQNQPPANRAGVIQGLTDDDQEDALAMSRIVKERDPG